MNVNGKLYDFLRDITDQKQRLGVVLMFGKYCMPLLHYLYSIKICVLLLCYIV